MFIFRCSRPFSLAHTSNNREWGPGKDETTNSMTSPPPCPELIDCGNEDCCIKLMPNECQDLKAKLVDSVYLR